MRHKGFTCASLLLMAPLLELVQPRSAFAQESVSVVAEVQVGRDWRGRGGAVEVGVASERFAAEVLWDESGIIVAVFLLYFPRYAGTVSPYAGIGLGYAAGGDLGLGTVPVRLGLEVPFASRFSIRLEMRNYIHTGGVFPTLGASIGVALP
jgi:hypothetical protein